MTSTFQDLVDLASERFGAVVVSANDEFFASKDNLIKPAPPAWREGVYTDRGKWMDGWETRRRREVTSESHDWCVIRLGARAIVRGVDVETTHFRGNYPEACAVDVGDGSVWHEVLARRPLQGDQHNLFAIESAPAATHLRLRIYPDGGIARLRAHGEVVADWERLRRRGEVDLGAAEHGGLVVACSDMFFGSRYNLIMPGDATHMGDGWETRRRRGPGYDWTIIRLATRGTIRRVEVDTRHFKGNAPGACSLEASVGSVASIASVGSVASAGDHVAGAAGLDELQWRELLPRTPLEPDTRHLFEDEVRRIDDVTHVRFNIYPDGGVGRLRLHGRPCASRS